MSPQTLPSDDKIKMRPLKWVPIQSDWYPGKRGNLDTQRHQECLRTEERSCETHWEGHHLQPQKKTKFVNILIVDSWPPELWERNFCCFSHPMSVVCCYGDPSKQLKGLQANGSISSSQESWDIRQEPTVSNLGAEKIRCWGLRRIRYGEMARPARHGAYLSSFWGHFSVLRQPDSPFLITLLSILPANPTESFCSSDLLLCQVRLAFASTTILEHPTFPTSPSKYSEVPWPPVFHGDLSFLNQILHLAS